MECDSESRCWTEPPPSAVLSRENKNAGYATTRISGEETEEFLEYDLDGQLHVELLTRAQTGSPIKITDSVTDQPEAVEGFCRRGRAPVCRKIFGAGVEIRGLRSSHSHGSRPRREINPVQEIKDIRLQADPNPLGYREALKDRQVDTAKARSVVFVAGEISVN